MRNLNQTQALDIPILSEILRKPIPKGKLLVGLYEPSAQWLSFVLTLASLLLKRGANVGIVTLTTPPSQLRQQLTATLPNIKEIEAADRLKLIDWYTWMTGKKSIEPRSVDTLALAQFNIQDAKYQKEDSPLYDFVASDNSSAFLKYNDERAVIQWLDKTIARMRELKGVRLYGFVKHYHSDAFYAYLESMADGVVELDNRVTGKGLENAIRVKSLKGISHPTEWHPLKMSESGLMTLASRRK